jgi:hypothetical protein
MEDPTTSVPPVSPPLKKKKKKKIKILKKVKKIIRVKRKKERGSLNGSAIKKISSPTSSVRRLASPEQNSVVKRLSSDPEQSSSSVVKRLSSTPDMAAMKKKKKHKLKKIKKDRTSPSKKRKVVKRETKKDVKLIKETQVLKSETGGIQLQFGEDDRQLGQKYPSPSPGEGMRVFYESLLIQRNDSKIALKWCTEHGVYPVYTPEKAVKMLEKLAKSSSSSSSSSSKVKKKKKRKLKERSDQGGVVEDIGMSVGIWEGQGSVDI